MTPDELQAAQRIARSFIEIVAREQPEVAAAIISLVMSHILAGLFDKDEAGVTALAAALNTKIAEIALAVDAPTSWQLVRAERPTRQ